MMKKTAQPLLALLVFCFALAAQGAPVLVETEWLASQLAEGKAAEKLVVVDMSDDPMQYMRFHVPGAVRLDYAQLVQQRGTGGATQPMNERALAALLGNLGISRGHHVIVYDDMGGLNAGRLFWELERIAHPQVSVLNGGLVKWIQERRPVSASPAQRLPATYAIDKRGRANAAALADVKQAARSSATTLLDVRSEEEYVGDRKQPRSGHVPGARWWPWEQAIDMEQGFVMRDAGKLEQSLKSVGIVKTRPVLLYCRSGHRAAHTYLTLRSVGFDAVSVYAGSMLEYAAHRDTELRQGNQP